MAITSIGGALADGTTKTQNTEFFTTDLSPQANSVFHIQLTLASDVALEVTFDTGTNWTALNGNVTLGVDKLHTFSLFMQRGDLFNMRIPTAGGSVIDHIRVVEETV